MRALLILVLMAPLLHASAGQPEPHIVDEAHDVGVSQTPKLSVPHPAVDLRSVTFSVDGDELVATTVVTDVDYAEEPFGFEDRNLLIYFHSDSYDRVYLSAYQRPDGTWGALLRCILDGDLVRFDILDAPMIDLQENSITIRAPLDWIGGRVLDPRASANLSQTNTPGIDTRPTVGFQDYAPNQGSGQDFDPATG